MSKIICDVCGTTYPETAAQCPICGCATPGEVDTVADDSVVEETVAYVPTKGGRFSKSNVRKRNQDVVQDEAAEEVSEPVVEDEEEEEPEQKRSNKGLMITAILLLLAIVAVVIYIAFRFFLPAAEDKKPVDTTPVSTTVSTEAVHTATQAPTETEVATEPENIPCAGLNLAENSVLLNEAGKMWLLNVTPYPENTTDVLTFTSENEAIATVDQQGCITAVAPGEAIITISCGEQKATVLVDCVFIGETPEETTDNEETTAEEEETEEEDEEITVADPNAEYYVLFYGEWREDNDITLAYGESVEVTLEDENGNVAKVNWVADEEGIVEIDGNTFTGNYSGVAYVTAEFGGKTYTVIVRVW